MKLRVYRKFLTRNSISKLILLFFSIIIANFRSLQLDYKSLFDFGYSRNFIRVIANWHHGFWPNSNIWIDTGGLVGSPSSEMYKQVFREPIYFYFLKFNDYFNIKLVTTVFIQVQIYALTLALLSWILYKRTKKLPIALLFLTLTFLNNVINFYSNLIYPFVISNFLLALATYLIAVSNYKYRYQTSGVFLAIASFERLTLVSFIIFLFLYSIYKRGQGKEAIRKISISALLLILTLSLINLLNSGRPLPSSTGYNLGYSYGQSIFVSLDKSKDSYSQIYARNISKYGADSGTLITIGSFALIDSNLPREDARIAQIVARELFKHPSIILKHLARSIVHYPDNLITFNIDLKQNYEKIWWNSVRGFPGVRHFADILSIAFFYLFLLITPKIRQFKNDIYLQFCFLYVISQYLVIVFLTPDSRYRGLSDFLILMLFVEVIAKKRMNVEKIADTHY